MRGSNLGGFRRDKECAESLKSEELRCVNKIQARRSDHNVETGQYV